MIKNHKNIEQITKELSILVSLYGLSFKIESLFSGEKKIFEYLFSPINSVQLAKKLNQIIEERSILKENFKKINLVYHNNLNTLVPEEVFQKEYAASFLQKNVKVLPTDFIEYDLFSTFQLVNVYVPFNFVKDYFKGSLISTQHSATYFFNKLPQIRKTKEELSLYEIFLNIFPYDFQIIVLKNERLELYNHFTYENVDEFLFYFFFVLETLKIPENNFHVYIVGIEKDHLLIKNLNDFTNKISIIPPHKTSQFNNFI